MAKCEERMVIVGVNLGARGPAGEHCITFWIFQCSIFRPRASSGRLILFAKPSPKGSNSWGIRLATFSETRRWLPGVPPPDTSDYIQSFVKNIMGTWEPG